MRVVHSAVFQVEGVGLGIALADGVSPPVESLPQAMVTGVAHGDVAGLSALPGDRSDAAACPQDVVVSLDKRLMCLGEHRGGHDSPYTWLGEEDLDVTVLARESVDLTITIDGGDPRTYALEPGEGRSFEADLSLAIRLSSGQTAQVTVNGRDLGFPGEKGQPWQKSLTYASPTPQG